MRLDELGGLAKTMPFLALTFGVATFASIGLPGFANFASELMVFFGAFGSGSGASGLEAGLLKRFDFHQVATVCGLWGVVISAIYMLRAYRRIFLGQPHAAPVPSGVDGTALPGDLLGGQRWALALLLAGLITVGFQPKVLVMPLKPVLTNLLPANVSDTTAASFKSPVGSLQALRVTRETQPRG